MKLQIQRARKKPVEITLARFESRSFDHMQELVAWIKEGGEAWHNGEHVFIETLEGSMQANVGDWIIRGVKGEFYPCKPDILAMSYDLLSSEDPDVEG